MIAIAQRGGQPALSCRTNVPSKLHFKDGCTHKKGLGGGQKLPEGNTDEESETEDRERGSKHTRR